MTLEYKSEVNRGFLKTVSAFANFNGGRIVFGVDDGGAVVGLDDPKQACLDIENRIRETLRVRSHRWRSQGVGGKNPKKAFREAVANALAHRIWDVDACVRISLSEDGAEVVSPGGLVPGMTKEAYLEGRFSLLRNPVLAESMFRAGLIERFGTGVRRIRGAYEGTGSSPSFEAGDGYISVKLPFVDRRSALTDEERSVLDAVPENRLVSRSTVSEVTGYEKMKTVRQLNSLVAKGYLRQEGEGRGRRYARAD